MSVYAKLQQARTKLHSMELKKSGHNKFAGYKYFELADFIVPIQKIFDELKLCGVVSFGTDLATLTIVDFESNEKIEITSPMSTAALKGCHEVQNLGAVETYIRRYLWVTALEIVEHDALDSSEPINEPEGKRVAKAIAAAKATPTAGAMDELSKEDQEALHTLSRQVIEKLAEGNDWGAYETLEHAKLNNDQKIAIWTLFNSKQRATLKQMKQNELASAP